jgi:hypothetical protein
MKRNIGGRAMLIRAKAQAKKQEKKRVMRQEKRQAKRLIGGIPAPETAAQN